MAKPTTSQAEGLEPCACRVRQMHRKIDGPITGWQLSAEPVDFVGSRHRWEVEPLVRLSDAQHWKDRAMAAEGREAAALSLPQYDVQMDDVCGLESYVRHSDLRAALTPAPDHG